MIRERSLKAVLVIVGLLFTAAVYPVVVDLWNLNQTDYGDDMALSLYFALGVFLLLAVRNPSAHRSLIGFTAWSSFAHGTVMLILATHIASERVGGLFAAGLLYLIGVTLIALLPGKQAVERAAVVTSS